ncbi:sigma-70 family RNA polymerase sigma factor [Anoxynatronum sibiricum]|uniref:RNA polymerase sigma factor SigI n=1 Tax=Anoxynatronum sibiricum TaxID=210623 RepID=A0ABU9VVT8_9CLOT
MPSLLKHIPFGKKLEKRVISAQSGSESERNMLIREYAPFIKKNLSQQLGRYIEEENDDVFSVGLMAFNEAIDHYQLERGSFLPFAATVIRNRAIDHLRKNKGAVNEMPFTALGEEGIEGVAAGQVRVLWRPPPEETLSIQEEMQQLVKRLAQLGLTLDNLVENAPKHEDTRRNAIRIARFLYEQQDLREAALKSGRMPLKRLQQEYGVTKKTVDRSKQFILAVMMILDSDLETMKTYIQSVEEGSK